MGAVSGQTGGMDEREQIVTDQWKTGMPPEALRRKLAEARERLDESMTPIADAISSELRGGRPPRFSEEWYRQFEAAGDPSAFGSPYVEFVFDRSLRPDEDRWDRINRPGAIDVESRDVRGLPPA